MVTWINNQRANKADVVITLVGKERNNISFMFAGGALATKFKHAPRILVGYEDGYLCFAPSPDDGVGYKVCNAQRGDKGKIQLRDTLFEGFAEGHELCGNWVLDYDKDTGISRIKIK